MTATATWRTTFVTPRSLEYFNEAGLRALIGHDKPLWPLTLIKELTDNALDACEAADIPPKIAITVEADSFSVSDNGPGLKAEIIKESLNYDTRISDKKWYVSPSRGQLGSALKTLWPACHVATGQRSVVEITACGLHHTITACAEGVKSHDEEPDTVKNGTFIKAHWPQIACQLTHEGRPTFYRGNQSYAGRMDEIVVDVIRDFAAANPHATFSVSAGSKTETLEATNSEWKKWRTCDRGSAHWCSVDDMRNLLAAHHREQQRLDQIGVSHRRLTLRDVLADFDGLKGTKVRKRVLEQAGLSGLSLDDVFDDDDAFVAFVAQRLLDAARANTRVVKPERLGLIGKEHMGKTLAAYGVKTSKHRYIPGMDADGLPFLLEAAFGVRIERSRKMVFAVNNSVVCQVPAERIFETLNACRVESHDPVVLVVHATCPKFAFTSQGKNSLMMSAAMQQSLEALLLNVTTEFTKMKKSKEAREHHDALTQRQIEKSMERDRVLEEKNEIKATAYKFMAEAYRRASEPYNWAKARQVMYQMRQMVMDAIGKWGGDSYFTQHLLVDYQREHKKECENWNVRYDARGHMLEPHGGKFFGIGTVETRDYIDSWTEASDGDAKIGSLHLESMFPTSGPANRFRAALYCEKEGFDDLIRGSGIMERYDMGLFSSKGQSTVAARELDDELSQAGVTIFALHDFDASGMRIAHWLSHDNDRYQFKEPPKVIDIGLRLADVKRMKLDSERVEYAQGKDPRELLLDCDGITEDEIAFLVSSKQWNEHERKEVWTGRRVELNAMTSRQFIQLIERKLEEHGVKKVLPDRATLKIAWERAEKVRLINSVIDEAMERVNRKGATRPAPRNLASQVREMLRRKPLMPWDEALSQLARKAIR